MSNVVDKSKGPEEVAIDDARKTVNRGIGQDAPVDESIDVGPSSEPRVILDLPVDWTGKRHQPIDISTTASRHFFRFVNCNQLTKQKRLQIVEYPHLSDTPYATISYVWRGKTAELDGVATFQVAGALNANPVSVEILHYICVVAEKEGVNYLWLDLLCIMQSDDDDKSWQIEHMYELYTCCTLCIVLPAGLQYIPRLDEETGWIHRGWTLQETVAPKRTVVLFQWTFGSGFVVASSGYGQSSTVTEVVPGYAIAAASDVINACVVGFMFFFRKYPGDDPRVQPLFAMQTRIFGQLSSNLLSLAAAMDNVIGAGQDVREHAIWQCAMMRNTYDPVDMVFSIMGLFGVTLQVKGFAKHDRLGATIALARKVLESGKSASWLGTSFRLPPCRYLATFPIFPLTGLAEKALVRTKDGLREMSDFMDCEFPNADALQSGMPTGTMDDAGYLTFTSRYAYVVPEHQQSESNSADLLVKAVDGSVWKVVESPPTSPPTFAVIVGWFNEYTPGKTLALHYYWIKVVLVRDHAPGKAHIILFGAMNQKFRKDVMMWKTGQFTVGGPHPVLHGQQHTGDESEVVEVVRDDMGFEMRKMGTQGRSYKTWKDLNAPRAAKAWSQVALEKFYATADRDTRLPTDWAEKGFDGFDS
ncbi:hypothetical protein JVT61DRAFT_14090 [Boletus reticuloceps]|uniref:Heterokaryon incompatibility domain-containing protein n=1 Tax=Boletus reticuloceps TaxID=495285 RepID=A0A8I3ADE5_9AGAM|nr:hypothetical protein JVT61DRAFT_14090 [Boletus reticuloceps]